MRRVCFALVCLALLVFFAGCATLGRWEKVEIGMTPTEVKDVMGRPTSLEVSQSTQGLTGSWAYINCYGDRRYEVIFDKGKVVEKHAASCKTW